MLYVFAAATVALLTLAAVLSYRLSHPTDHLGLHAARAEIVADMRHRVAAENQRRALRKSAAFVAVYGTGRNLSPSRELTAHEARELVGRFAVQYPRLTQAARSPR